MKLQVWPIKGRWLLKIIILAAVYFTAARLGLSMAFADTNVSPVWPPTGVALAAILLFGYSLWPGIFIGELLANVISFTANDVPLTTAITTSGLMAIGNSLEAVIGVFLIRRFIKAQYPLDRARDVFKFIALGVLLAPTVSAAIGVFSLGINGIALWSGSGYLWWTWWVGNALGVLLITPIVLVLANKKVCPPWPWKWRPQRQLEAIGLLILLTVMTGVIFNPFLELTKSSHYHTEYLIFLMVIWITFRFGQIGATLSSLIVATIAVWHTTQNSGPFVADTTNDSLLLLQTYLAIIAAMALVLAGALTERKQSADKLKEHRAHLEEIVADRTVELTRTNQQLQQEINERQRAEEIGRKSEARFKSIVEQSFDVIVATNTAGLLTYVSPSVRHMSGYKPQDMLGRHFRTFFVKADLEKANLSFAKVMRGENIEGLRMTTVGRNNTQSYVEMNSGPIYKDDQIVGVQAIYRDITQRKQAEDSLRRERDLLEQLMQTSPVGITMVNHTGQITFANRQAEKVLGLTKDEIIDKTYNAPEWRITDYDGNPFPNKGLPFSRVITTRKAVYDIRHGIEWPDGRRVLLSINGAPLLGETGKVEQVVLTIDDVTERVDSEMALQESNQRLQLIMNNIPLAIFWKSKNLTFQGCNHQFAIDAGFDSPNEVIGKNDFDMPWAEQAESYQSDDRWVIESGTPQLYYEESQTTLEGDITWLRTSKIPLLDTGGNCIGLLGIYEDITERRYAQQTLQIQHDIALSLRETDRLPTALNKLLDVTIQMDGIDCGGIYMVDISTGAIKLISSKGLSPQFVEAVTYYPADSLQVQLVMVGNPIYQNYAELLPITYRIRQDEGLRAMAVIPIQYEGKTVAVLNLASRTYHNIPVDTRIILESVADQIGGLLVQVRTEAALRESEENLQRLFYTLDDFLFILDMEGNILRVNSVVETRLGYSAEELSDQHVLYVHPPDQHKEAMEIIQAMLMGEATICPVPLKAKDGTLIPVDTKVTAGKWSGQDVLIGISRDITERIKMEEALRQRNQNLAMLNEASRALSSTLELDEVLKTVLEEVHRLHDVLACSVWLIDPHTKELVCKEVTDPQRQVIHGWRLSPGEGLVGWAVQHKQSLNVPDVSADARHYKQVDEKTGLQLRSILTVPLIVKKTVLGVMQVVSEEVARFDDTHQTLLESLAATAAIAIQNAQWFEQVRQDAETKLTLLNEVNHRVKNNLTAIIGLLYAERRHATQEERSYREMTDTLINRVQGLAAAHDLLSAAEWRPLPLSNLTQQIINAALQILSANQHIKVNVTPSPIEVSPAQANQLALIINELVTNVMKYALTDDNKIDLTVKITEQENTIYFEFRDNGPGYPEKVLTLKQYNVGLYLIKNLVQNGLQGELELFNDAGAVTIIQFQMTS